MMRDVDIGDNYDLMRSDAIAVEKNLYAIEYGRLAMENDTFEKDFERALAKNPNCKSVIVPER